MEKMTCECKYMLIFKLVVTLNGYILLSLF